MAETLAMLSRSGETLLLCAKRHQRYIIALVKLRAYADNDNELFKNGNIPNTENYSTAQ